MDTRLIFRDYLKSIKTDGGTQTVSSDASWCQLRVKGDPDRQIRLAVSLENPLRLGQKNPYHKPTQVDKMSILRRSGDGLFRN